MTTNRSYRLTILLLSVASLGGCNDSPDSSKGSLFSSRPTEARVIEAARGALSRSEDGEYFQITNLEIDNTLSEDSKFTAIIKYTVMVAKDNVFFSTTGAKHILPIGSVEGGQTYKGTFRLVMGKYDKGWEVESYSKN